MGPRAVFHLFSFLAFSYVCYFDYTLVKGDLLPIPGQFFSKFVWLTLIDLYLQALYHLIGFVVASVGGRHPVFHFLARSLVGPIGMSVVVLFWALFLFDPNTLLADENAKKIIAIQWYNHGLHTLPLVTIVLDLLIWNHGQPSTKKTLIAISTFSILYIIDIHYVQHISGFWAYPILGQLPLPLRAAFIAVCVGIFFVNFKILSVIHGLRHGTEQPKRKRN